MILWPQTVNWQGQGGKCKYMCVGGATQVPKPVRLLLIWPFGFVWFSTNSYQDDWHAWMMLLYTFSTTKSIHPPKRGVIRYYYCRKRRAERRGFISSIKIYSTSWERNTAVWFLGKVYQAIRLGLNGGSIICLCLNRRPWRLILLVENYLVFLLYADLRRKAYI